MEKRIITLLTIVALVGICISQSLYTVQETETAIVLQLGKPVKDDVAPGLNFKLPFIQNVIKFDHRILTYDSKPAEALTKDKKNIVIDNYARWRITQPLLFYQSLRTVPQAQSRLVDIVYSDLRAIVGQYNLGDIVSASKAVTEENATAPQAPSEPAALGEPDISKLTGNRLKIMKEVIERSNLQSSKYGVEIIDVRIKRIDLPTENQRAIFGRMRTEREQQAQQYRSEGTKEATIIRSEANRKAQVLLAEAKRDAEIMMGSADAKAIEIFASAFNKNADFFEFSRSLDAYKNSLKENNRILMPLGEDFLKNFK